MNREVMRRAGRPSVVLLIEHPQGGLLAVRFPDADAARAWEDEHPEVIAQGVANYMSDSQALREIRNG